MERKYQKKKMKVSKSYVMEYNEALQANVFRILDPEEMFPCYFQDPEAGTYKIIKTSTGRLHMVK